MKPHQSYTVRKIQEELYHVVNAETRRIIHVMRTEEAAELSAEELNKAALEFYPMPPRRTAARSATASAAAR